MQVRPKIALTFANCLKHILRQDPDIIMIGEIRDLETAEIAIQASLTGHLVLSTLHTNDAASAITRLVDMGIEPYLISATVVGVMAQRLLRVICPNCKEPYEPKEGSMLRHELEKLADGRPQLYQGFGCGECLNTGYRGRTGIFELLLVDHDIRDVIVEQRGPHLMKKAAIRKGMATLREDGLRKALTGVTTLAEVYRVTQDTVRFQGEVRSRARV
jgi:general secretion pathway protein E